jgi:predicted naringenin-chalcone synthase
MALYQNEMGKALEFVLSNETLTSSPTHLLHVTCSGYAAPSIAQQWVSKRAEKMPSLLTPIVQHIYHMGCYASVPALRTAQGLLAIETDASVAIVHTEFCSLHLHAVTTSPEQWVVQSLFADAVVKYEATAQPPKGQRSLRLLCTLERIAPASTGDMTWNLTDKRFEMTLSRDVPAKLRECLRPFVKDLLARAGLSLADLPHMIAAIHPGGPRIIDQVMQSLDLDEAQATWSRKTLYEHGNVSSATLPLLWKSLIDASEVPSPARIFCLAFGPGLTLAGAVLEMTEAAA